MGLKDLNDKASDYLDSKGLANPVEVVNEALGGETREESRKRRDAAKVPAPLSLEERKKAAADKAHKEYTSDKKNWPLNPREDAINSAKAADAVTKKRGGKVSYKSGGSVSASRRADGCATKGKTRGRIV